MRFEKQQIAIVISFVALIAVFAILQYWPLRSRALAMEQVKSAQLAAGQKAEEQIKNLPALRDELRQAKSNVRSFKKRIPDEPMLGTFLKEIADVMNKHKLAEQMVQPDTEEQIGGNFVRIPLKMQCKGTFQNIYEFFVSLQNLDRLTKIEQVQLKNDQELSGTLTLIAQCNIYYKNCGLKHGTQ